MKDSKAMTPELSRLYSPAKAYWNKRKKLLSSRERIFRLHQAVDSPVDLSLAQSGQLFTFALDFNPDIILELGRGSGNSTVTFTEIANLVKPRSCKVLSLCKSPAWHKRTAPKLEKIVGKSWFAPLTALQTDILKFDFKQALLNKSRIFVFWDAHGYDLADCVLGTILPDIADRHHIVVMHDLSDTRYCPAPAGNYRLWRGNNDDGSRIRIGIIDSAVEQAISITDFANRNKLTLHSADYSLHTELSSSQKAELRKLLGNDLFSLSCHWFWFSLNEVAAPHCFPIPRPQARQRKEPLATLRKAIGSILEP